MKSFQQMHASFHIRALQGTCPLSFSSIDSSYRQAHMYFVEGKGNDKQTLHLESKTLIRFNILGFIIPRCYYRKIHHCRTSIQSSGRCWNSIYCIIAADNKHVQAWHSILFRATYYLLLLLKRGIKSYHLVHL
jgi:hypothetical protein